MLTLFAKLWKNFLHSLAGLRATLKRDLTFRLELLAVLCFTPIPFLINELSTIQKSLMVATLLLPMSIELLNSALEELCNVITKEFHKDIKFIKDAASASVLIAVIIMLVTWGLNLLPVLF